MLEVLAERNQPGAVSDAIVAADAQAAAAIADFQTSNYASAVHHARAAYDTLIAAADSINAKVPGPEKALRRWQRAKHASLRKLIADATTDLAQNFEPRVTQTIPVTPAGARAGRLAAAVPVAISSPVPDLRARSR